MTFEEFQKTRRHVDDLTSVINDARWDGEQTPSGHVYLDALYIEDGKDHWPAAIKALGRYHLLINRDEWISDDVEDLERRLYASAVSEGYGLP